MYCLVIPISICQLSLLNFWDVWKSEPCEAYTWHMLIVFFNVMAWSDSKVDKRSWNEKLGKCDFPLAFILLLNFHGSTEHTSHLSHTSLPEPSNIISLVRDFTSWIIWGSTEEESSAFFSHSTELALVLLRHGQFDAVQVSFYSQWSFSIMQ